MEQKENTKSPNTPPVNAPQGGTLGDQAAANASAGENKPVNDNVAPSAPKPETAAPKPAPADSRLPNAPRVAMPLNDVTRKIIDKIRTSENILVALSRDPSVDEMAAAIGLTMFLDGLQKHTTAIYSGMTPDALKFLQPEGTFETNTDSLQDFIIALSKDKADHLRYKLDGDFVKVYITPYKTTITESDLEFSHGDYNVDLVLALGVPSAADLDGALSEYGRIMHDATTVDITCDALGRFGEMEWSDIGASSVSEMITKLIFAMEGPDTVIDKEIATALLTGIVASTERFSNERTNSETMGIASKLMSMGADQQLISSHVMSNDSGVSGMAVVHEEPAAPVDKSRLMMGADYGNFPASTPGTVVQASTPGNEIEKAAAARQANVAMSTGSVSNAPTSLSNAVATATAHAAAAGATGVGITPLQGTGAVTPVNSTPSAGVGVGTTPVPSAQTLTYAEMMAQALAEPPMVNAPGQVASPQLTGATQTVATNTGGMTPGMNAGAGMGASASLGATNPAMMQAPSEAQPVMPMPPASTQSVAGAVLPPPPAPQTGGDMMPPVLPQVNA